MGCHLQKPKNRLRTNSTPFGTAQVMKTQAARMNSQDLFEVDNQIEKSRCSIYDDSRKRTVRVPILRNPIFNKIVQQRKTMEYEMRYSKQEHC